MNQKFSSPVADTSSLADQLQRREFLSTLSFAIGTFSLLDAFPVSADEGIQRTSKKAPIKNRADAAPSQDAETSTQLVRLIHEFEGLRLKAYVCPGGKLTIGYGHTAGVTKGQKLNDAAEAEVLLRQDITPHRKQVLEVFKGMSVSENCLDALTSATFNCGCLQGGNTRFARFLKAKVPALDDPETRDGALHEIVSYLCRFNRANQRFTDGLLRRRLSEGLMLADAPQPIVSMREYENLKSQVLTASKEKNRDISHKIPEMVSALFKQRGIAQNSAER